MRENPNYVCGIVFVLLALKLGDEANSKVSFGRIKQHIIPNELEPQRAQKLWEITRKFQTTFLNTTILCILEGLWGNGHTTVTVLFHKVLNVSAVSIDLFDVCGASELWLNGARCSCRCLLLMSIGGSTQKVVQV